MTYSQFEQEFKEIVGLDFKTKDVVRFNKILIKRHEDVSFLKNYVLEKSEYHRTYFHVSLAQCESLDDCFAFIEDNFELLQDWWHTDQIPVILGNRLDFDYAFRKAQQYIKSELPFVRRLGYVLFIPRLTKNPDNIEKLWSLLTDAKEYYVVMGEAWLISYLAMCDSEKTYQLLRDCQLKYNIVGKAIQKICDSYAISKEDKEKYKTLRETKKKSNS